MGRKRDLSAAIARSEPALAALVTRIVKFSRRSSHIAWFALSARVAAHAPGFAVAHIGRTALARRADVTSLSHAGA